jgi:ABC-2 type transport system permease protein
VHTIWYIAKKDLLQTLKDRNSFILLLAVPLVLITALGLAFNNLFGSGSSQISITVAVSNQDGGSVGTSIVNALKINTDQLAITVTPYQDTRQVIDEVAKSSNANAGVVIPAGTTDKVIAAAQSGASPQNLIQLYALPNNNDPRATIVQNIVASVMRSQLAGNSAVEQVYSVCNQPGNHCAQGTIDAQKITSSVGQASAVDAQSAVQALTAGEAVKINNFDQIVPGYAVFFALFGINAAAGTILQEKEDGTFRRLLIAPIQKYALLGGKLLAQFMLTLMQLLVLMGIGYFAFQLDIGSWPAVIALLVCTSFAATGLGILLVSVIKTRRQLNPIVTLVVLITSAIGGAWWPLFLEPPWMQTIAKLGITAWAMEGLNGIMIQGKDFTEVLPDMLGLLAYGIICFVIAMRFFRFEQKAVVA